MRLTADQRTALIAARKAAGLTTADIAEQIGISQPAVFNAETGQRAISEEVLEKWCRILGLTFSPSKPAEIGEPEK